MDINKALIERMEDLAKEKGTTLRNLVSQVGFQSTAFEFANRSTRSPDLTTIHYYCQNMGVSLKELFDDERFC